MRKEARKKVAADGLERKSDAKMNLRFAQAKFLDSLFSRLEASMNSED